MTPPASPGAEPPPDHDRVKPVTDNQAPTPEAIIASVADELKRYGRIFGRVVRGALHPAVPGLNDSPGATPAAEERNTPDPTDPRDDARGSAGKLGNSDADRR